LNLKNENPCFNKFGLKNLDEWMGFELNDIPGLFVISNPFKNGFQRYFVKKCLCDYHELPNKTNLDLHSKRDTNLWTK
jgi:alkylated DNA repair protein alkB family protein 1